MPPPVARRPIDCASEPEDAACRGIQRASRDAAGFVGCAADERRARRLEAAVVSAIAEGSPVRLMGLDRIARLPALAAGACAACLQLLHQRLHRSYGPPECFTPPDLPREWRASLAGGEHLAAELPFGREHLLSRLELPRVLSARLCGAARDEARRREAPTLVEAQVTGLSPLLPRLAGLVDLLLLEQASLLAGRLAAEVALSRAGTRPVVLTPAPGDRSVASLAAAAFGAATVGCDVELPAGAPADAVAVVESLRAFRRELPDPEEAVADVAVLYDARSDVLGDGRHGKLAAAITEAVAAAGFLVRACTRVGGAPEGSLLLLAGCTALSPKELRAAWAHVRDGGDLAVLGAPAAVDDDGLPVQVEGPRLEPGELRLGRGKLFVLAEDDDPSAAALRACRALRPDALRLARVTGRGKLLLAAHHAGGSFQLRLCNQERDAEGFVAPQGLVLHLGARLQRVRTATLRGPGGVSEPIRVSGAARGTSLVLPELGPYSVLVLS